MSRLLLALMILLTGCENFTLIGSVNVGVEPIVGDPGHSVGQGGDEEDESDGPCWPAASAAVAEIRRHGYDRHTWVETAEWFTKLEPVANSLPPCPAE